MKVLLVTEASAAGVGRHVVDLAHGLLERGCEVHLVYSPLRMDGPFRTGIAELEDLRASPLTMHRAPRPADLGAMRRYRRFVNGPAFDVVHAHSSKAGLIVRSAGGHGNARVLYTPHCIYTMNPDAGKMMSHATRAAERMLAPRTDAIIAVSLGEREHIVEMGLGQDRVHYIPNGPREQNWRSREQVRGELGFTEDEVVLGFLGRLMPQKDPALLLHAFAQLRASRPKLRLCMVGDGPMEAEVQSLARSIDLDDAIVWTGARNPDTVMRGFDVFVMPSAYEAMPYVLLEALAAGLPIVATPVGGVPSTVENGGNGAVSTGHSPQELGEALQPLTDDHGLRERYAARSLERAREFSADTMVDSTLALYRVLTDGHSSSR
ncbi:MAG: glycosyltransferase family 4 protein [bacterium]|nr:glycosyltransferase family 4 protein [bacterium]